MPKIVELKQNSNLICPQFDGYKLSLDPVPVFRQEHSVPPHRAQRNDEQYSLFHTELFAMQNLLFVDPWLRHMSYFINKQNELVRTCYDEKTGRPQEPQVVFRINDAGGAGDNVKMSSTARRIRGDYNYSLRFISEEYCLLCNGIQKLLLLDTGNRLVSSNWQVLAATDINVLQRNFLIYDCSLNTLNGRTQISCALGRVERAKSAGFKHQLYWAKWLQDADTSNWEFSIAATLEGKGSLYYCAFDPLAEALVISSNQPYKFNRDMDVDEIEEPQPQQQQMLESEEGSYTWTQTEEDVTIKFLETAGKTIADYKITTSRQHVRVTCGGQVLLDKEVWATIEPGLTTWTLDMQLLVVMLTKRDTMDWPALAADASGPKEGDEEYSKVAKPLEQKPVVNLEAPVEDCDYPMGFCEQETRIDRFYLPAKHVTHSVLMGSTPPIFATILRPGYPPALAIRQDVDTSLWLMQLQNKRSTEDDSVYMDWSLMHMGNLHAFGYVQASKTQRKFIDCAPDLSYALICESHRHLFLYRSKYGGLDNLLNRKSRSKAIIGKQQLVTLENAGEVLGVATADHVITLLTERCILYLQIE